MTHRRFFFSPRCRFSTTRRRRTPCLRRKSNQRLPPFISRRWKSTRRPRRSTKLQRTFRAVSRFRRAGGRFAGTLFGAAPARRICIGKRATATLPARGVTVSPLGATARRPAAPPVRRPETARRARRTLRPASTTPKAPALTPSCSRRTAPPRRATHSPLKTTLPAPKTTSFRATTTDPGPGPTHPGLPPPPGGRGRCPGVHPSRVRADSAGIERRTRVQQIGVSL
jgi:hypothetical protein